MPRPNTTVLLLLICSVFVFASATIRANAQSSAEVGNAGSQPANSRPDAPANADQGNTPRAAPSAAMPTWLTSAVGAGASAEIVNEYSPTLTKIEDMITRTGSAFEKSNWRTAELDKANENLAKAQATLRAFVGQLTPKLTDARARLAKLGPAPKEGETESDALKAQRKEISDEVGAYDALIKRADVLSVQAGQVVASFSAKRRQRFVRQILRQSEGLNNRSFWHEALTAAPRQLDRLIGTVSLSVKARISSAWGWLSIALILLVAAAVTVAVLLHRLLRNGGSAKTYEVPSRPERGAMVLRRSFALSAPVLVLLGIMLLAASSFEIIISEEFVFFARCAVYIGVATFLISAVHFALLPSISAHRLISIDTRAARQLSWVLTLFVVVWLVDQLATLLDEALLAPLSLIIVRSLFTAIIFGLLMAGLLVIFIDRKDSAQANLRTNGWPRALFGAIAITSLFILGAAAFGYVSLARFVGSQIVATGGLVLFVTLVHLTAEFVSTPVKNEAPEEGAGAITDHAVISTTLGVLIGLALDLLVLLIGVPLLLLQWGYEWAEVRGWLSSAFFGFQIGGLRLSLLTIFSSIGILLAGIILTRIVRKMFMRRSQHLFAGGSGARDSIGTVLSYAGFVLAVVAALSYLGVEVANLALIAGALSVGIGFGLQSIANNFVSGLILLAERPIKAGDWIVVGNREGRVQKISVRSTQIRTFDRSTVIVPNADLITGQVVNWDHGDTVGRVIINVGVSYASDPREVIELLTKIGASHPLVLRSDTSPLVVFEGFGDSSMDFTMRIMLRDIKNSLRVQTDLRVWIVEKFRERGIEIPFPQRDLRLLEIPGREASKAEVSTASESPPEATVSGDNTGRAAAPATQRRA